MKFLVRNSLQRSGIAMVISIASLFSVPIARSVQLADGTVFFVSPPRLAESSTTQNYIRAWSVTYYFTLDVPANAGEPLQKVTIRQEEGSDTVRYLLNQTAAFEGKRGRLGQRIAIANTVQDPKTNTVTVTFDPPVPTGKTVTIALAPRENPAYAGVYLFGVTAFPPGEKTHGQFLGFGRFNIYELGPFFW